MKGFVTGTAVLGVALLAGTMELGTQTQSPQRTVAAQSPDRGDPPELPRVKVEIPDLTATGRTIHVPAGGNLQAALDEAKGGDRITLEPRATYRGPFRLRRKDGDGWIIVTSASRDVPPAGRHVTPADAPKMPKLVAPSGSVFEAEPGAHHFRLVALEIAPVEGTSLIALVRLGEDERSLDAVPHHFIVDRCYLHGDARLGGRRGVALNSSHTAVIDSYIADFKERTVDTQAIGGWNGPGPYRIAGNYLEAAGENIMFGGADPGIPNLVPADIEIVRNHFAKPLRWKKDDRSFEGTEWSVKNLFELKNARRVLVDGNLLEYNWPHAQNGFAVLFTVRNQDGGAPWSVVEDVTFTNNLVRHVAGGINILGRDDNNPSEQTKRIAIRNNVFQDVGGRWGNGRLFQLLNGTSAVIIDHNTAGQTGSVLFGGDSEPHTGFVFQNNLLPHNEYGITGSSTGPGNPSIERYFPGAVVRRNVLVGAPSGSYPRDNFFPSSFVEAGLATGAAGGKLKLGQAFAAKATDGRDPGADVEAVERALGGLATVGPITDTASNAQLATPNSQGLTSKPRTPSDGAGLLSALSPAVVGRHELGVGNWESGVGWFAKLLFWICLVLMAYTYVGYALVTALRARLRPQVRQRAPIEPSVSIVVVAYNEADRIAARIENLLGLDYPADRVQIVVASDGSTDSTVEQAMHYRKVVVRAYTRRRGKAAVLNAVVPSVHGDIVVFADARQRFESGTLRALVENFADPTVGAVSGELVLATDEGVTSAGHGAACYWRFEKFIRSTEGRASSTVGATGAIYAIRRALFEPIPEDTILDDVVIPLRIVRQGFRVLFDARARAHDHASTTARQEFVRKARTIAGTFQLFARESWLLNPRRNRIWFETMSHKGLRLTLPLLHGVLLVATCALASDFMYGWALAAQLMFYAAALVGASQRQIDRHLLVFSMPCAICLLLWATIVGFVRFAGGRQQVTWERAPVSPSRISA